LAEWAKSFGPEVVVMESTGIYWKSPYAALENVGIAAWVVNARHVKTVPGRKTDVADAQWLATLARAGLLRASFIPPADIRHLRLIARQRQKLGGMLSSEKNRLHKLLADAGIRLNVVVSDIHGQAARAMVKALIEGQSQNNNKRPVLAMHQRMTIAENGTWSSMREWVGVGQQVIARETVEWDQEHMRVSAYVNGLEEFSSVAVRSGSSGVSLDTQLRATPTKGQTREWRLNVPFTSVSLSSLPFLIAKHWPALMAGQVLYASYLVLKVQRAATVRIARKVGHLEGSQVVIEVAPTNVVLRFIFGTTTMQFVGDSPNLARMDGLLDLRDMRRNGQWRGVSRHPGISSTLRFERFCWC